MTEPTKTCSSHCRTCGRHFSGDTAFDRHRVGSFKADQKSLEGRRCKDPESDDWFESVDGECRISEPGAPPKQIVIWRQSGAAERTRGLREAVAA